LPGAGSWLVQIDDGRGPADPEGDVPTDGEPEDEYPLGDLTVFSVLGGYPAVAERELPRPLDDLLVDAESVTEALPSGEAEDAEDAEDGVLHTESAAGESESLGE
jgi:hypothetical protein